MIATHNQQASTDGAPLNIDPVQHPISIAAPHFPGRPITHHPKAGLNPLVDAASYLFSSIGKLKQSTSCHQLGKLHNELMHEVSTFQEIIKQHGYNAEYVLVCRYILCATLDDIIGATDWGNQSQWEPHSLLKAFSQDTHHQDKFFSLMERAIKDPAHYIDLMELMYICLSLGYQGHYPQLEQITNTLYKHIRAYRGGFSKILSPIPLRTPRGRVTTLSRRPLSTLRILIATVCLVMILFIGLSYLMEMISNEAFKNISELQTLVSLETPGQ